MFDFFGVVLTTILALLAVRAYFKFFVKSPSTGGGKLWQIIVASIIFFAFFAGFSMIMH